MYTYPEYSKKIKKFLKTQLIPQSEGKKLSLNEIYDIVIAVYPEKWVQKTDVFDLLESLGYSPSVARNEKGKPTSFYDFS